MKRRRVLSLLLCVLLLGSLMAGCGFGAGDRDAYVDMVPFGEMAYERPDLDAALAERPKSGSAKCAAS